jgi:hypothetical protein
VVNARDDAALETEAGNLSVERGDATARERQLEARLAELEQQNKELQDEFAALKSRKLTHIEVGRSQKAAIRQGCLDGLTRTLKKLDVLPSGLEGKKFMANEAGASQACVLGRLDANEGKKKAARDVRQETLVKCLKDAKTTI